MHIYNFVNTLLQLNSINNINGKVLQEILTVIDDANILFVFYFTNTCFNVFLFVNQCF